MADALQLRWGFPVGRPSAAGAVGTFALNQATDQAEWVFKARATATITRLGFYYSSKTGTTPTYRISLQGVDGSGNPDGTVKGGGSPASATFSPSSLGWSNNSWQWVTLANSYAVSQGDDLAVVIDYSSGTVDASNLMTVGSNLTVVSLAARPYAISNDAGVRGRLISLPVFGYGSAGTAYGCPTLGTATQAVNGTTEAAARFTLPAAWASSYTLLGVRAFANLAAGQTLTYKLYDGGGASDVTALQTGTVDTDALNSGAARFSEDLYFPAPLSALTPGNTYRLGLSVGAGSHTVQCLLAASAADFDAWDGGQQLCLSTRNPSSGGWTDTATTRPFVELILGDLTGGGGSTPSTPRVTTAPTWAYYEG